MPYPKNTNNYQLAERLLPVLLQVTPGEIITYERIGTVIGRTFGSQTSRQILQIARSMAAKEGKLFSTMRRSGLRAFRPGDYEVEGSKKVATIHTAARKGYKIVDSISPDEFSELGHTQQLRHSMRQGQLEMLEKNSSKARFEKVVNRNHNGPSDGWNMKAVAEQFANLDTRTPKRKG